MARRQDLVWERRPPSFAAASVELALERELGRFGSGAMTDAVHDGGGSENEVIGSEYC